MTIRAISPLAPALLLAGCVSFNVGEPKPEVKQEVHTIYDEATAPTKTDVVATRLMHRANGSESVTIWLEANLREETARTFHTETTTITKQKRLAFGLFPGLAEHRDGVEGAFADLPVPLECFLVLVGNVAFGIPTVSSLFFELPFESYDNDDYLYLASSQLSLVGFHKYTTEVREGPVLGPTVVAEPKIRARNAVAVPGPFDVEFSIPDLNHRPAPMQSGRDGKTTFRLPSVSWDQTVRAYVSFQPSLNENPTVQKALAMASAKTQSFDITLHAPAPSPAPAKTQAWSQPAPEPTSVAATSQRLYNIRDIKPDERGRYFVRVEVLDQSQTLNIALRIIQPDVRRLVREDFQSKNPEIPVQDVRESLQYETESDGRFLVFTGWAFSVRPVKDGWSYDKDTRRGWVRLRIVGEMPAENAKRWARENISAIISEKNVNIEVWNAPPEGATYRSLDESFEDGVLTVEFEAVQ
ncbi:MAG: hypothetical protein ILM98_13175 [Kiritimatiellae bacterium]|nr:hypothetical protein [Kiritimatiellia bacterium]